MATARFIHDGKAIDYTPGSAVSAGDVVVINRIVGIAKLDIAANQLGALAVDGVFDIPKKNEVISAGAAVYWDADGDPVGGTAGTGALTCTAADGILAGFAVATAAGSATAARTKLAYQPVDAVV